LGNSPLNGEWIVRGSGARAKSFVLYSSFAPLILSNANKMWQAGKFIKGKIIFKYP